MKINSGPSRFHRLAVMFIVLTELFVSAAFVTSAALAQTTPTTITIDAPGAGTSHAQGTWATAINAGGVIAGYYVDSSGACHGFIRNVDGTYISFDTPLGQLGAPTCPQPASINASGAITGAEGDRSFGCTTWAPGDQQPGCGGSHGFIRMADGTITVFDGPVNPSFENPGNFPLSISATNAVVG